MKILVNDIIKILNENKINKQIITDIHTELLWHKKELENGINKNDLTTIINTFSNFFSILTKDEIINKVYKKECNFYACKFYEQITDKNWRYRQIKYIYDISNDIEKYENLDELTWLIPQTKCNKTIPVYWQENFELDKMYLKGSQEQGSSHGPDFIFLDLLNNYKVGVEFATAEIDTLVINNPNKFNNKKYINEAWKRIRKIDKHGYGSDTITLLLDVLKKHIKKLQKYELCHEYYLILRINKKHTRLLYWFYEEYLNIYKYQYYDEGERYYKYIYVV